MEKLSTNLTTLRKARGYTQNEISAKMFVSRQAVSKWERGESVPDIETLLALSELYSVTVDDMLKGDLKAEDVTAPKSPKQDFDDLKKLHKRNTIIKMLVCGIALLGIYSLICGILQTGLFAICPNIWLVWFTLPVIPPIIFAAVFRHDIGKKWLMFFFDVPFVSGLLFELIILSGNGSGAWIAFLLIPVFYSVAVAVFFILRKKEN